MKKRKIMRNDSLEGKGRVMPSGAIIPSRFYNKIAEHCFGNALDIEGYPLIMCIAGGPGMGKTWQLSCCLENLGLDPLCVSAARLEDERAGVPVKYLEKTYLTAGSRKRSGIPSAVIIDDFDTTVGEWEGYTGTVNHQTILAFLMHVAERPTNLEGIGETERVPIFITANHPERIYGPLLRYGRTELFIWDPDDEERADMVSSILGIARGNAQDLPLDLVQAFPNEPMSFFSHLFAQERSRQIAEAIDGRDLASVMKDSSIAKRVKAAFCARIESVDWMRAARMLKRSDFDGDGSLVVGGR